MATIAAPGALAPEELSFAARTIASYAGTPGALLSVLERIQEHHPHKYLPLDVLEYIGERMDIPLAQIYSVVTFYALFNLEPQGEHTICICRGTACHTRGSRNLLGASAARTGVPEESEERRRQAVAHHSRRAASRCARWPASGNARWLRWSRWITPSTAT